MSEYYRNNCSGELIEVNSPWINGQAKDWVVTNRLGEITYVDDPLYASTVDDMQRIEESVYKKQRLKKVLKNV